MEMTPAAIVMQARNSIRWLNKFKQMLPHGLREEIVSSSQSLPIAGGCGWASLFNTQLSRLERK
jgi:hypothetical protein